jgi:hypothetical protein
MHGAIEWQAFDNAARELIRKKLIRYMKDHGIGVPALAERIRASHPREAEIPVSTLQRFLANSVQRTNEPCVRLCHSFAESLTAFDHLAMLGERLSVFYGATDEYDYAGDYLSGAPALEELVGSYARHGFLARHRKNRSPFWSWRL